MARTTSRQSSRSRESAQSQPLMSNWMDTAKERPLATAAAVGGAVAAGVFLWSRRNQISDQLSQMSEQISEWSEGMRGESATATRAGGRSSTPLGTETGELEMAGAGTTAVRGSTRATGGRSGRAQRGQTRSPSRETPTPAM
jgi:hypothetical protein